MGSRRDPGSCCRSPTLAPAWTQPDAERPYRAKGYPIVPGFFVIAACVGILSAFVSSLVVGQAVTVVVQLQDRVKGLVLPAQAITRSPANEPVVWIKSGAQRFIPQPVQYRSLDAQRVVVTQGLAPDNRVVVQGAALIAQIR